MKKVSKYGDAKSVLAKYAIYQFHRYCKQHGNRAILVFKSNIYFHDIPEHLVLSTLVLIKHGEPLAAIEKIKEEFGIGFVGFGSDIINFKEFKEHAEAWGYSGYWINVMIVKVVPTSKMNKMMITKMVEWFLSNNTSKYDVPHKKIP